LILKQKAGANFSINSNLELHSEIRDQIYFHFLTICQIPGHHLGDKGKIKKARLRHNAKKNDGRWTEGFLLLSL